MKHKKKSNRYQIGFKWVIDVQLLALVTYLTYMNLFKHEIVTISTTSFCRWTITSTSVTITSTSGCLRATLSVYLNYISLCPYTRYTSIGAAWQLNLCNPLHVEPQQLRSERTRRCLMTTMTITTTAMSQHQTCSEWAIAQGAWQVRFLLFYWKQISALVCWEENTTFLLLCFSLQTMLAYQENIYWLLRLLTFW